LGVLLAAAVLLVVARRNRGPLASFLIFTGTLVPVLGFFNVLPFRYSWVADHFQYLASLGIVIPLAAWFTAAAPRSFLRHTGRITAAASLLAALSAVTWRQSGMYRDEETLYRATLARNPSSWLVHNNLGSVLEAKPGGLPEAIAEYKAAIRLEGRYPQAHVNLARALMKSNDPAQVNTAIDEYQTALRIKPDYVEAHTDLANLLSGFPDRMPEAVAHFRQAVLLQPGSAEYHANLASALAQSEENLPDAIGEFQTALRLDPNVAEVHSNLGVALAQSDRLPEAIAEFQASLRLNPGLPEVHFLLATAYSQTPERLPDAIAECQAALHINPGFQPARQLLQELRRAEN
jgi:tetratricopeptide (TPR) repeat protein